MMGIDMQHKATKAKQKEHHPPKVVKTPEIFVPRGTRASVTWVPGKREPEVRITPKQEPEEPVEPEPEPKEPEPVEMALGARRVMNQAGAAGGTGSPREVADGGR